MKFAVNTTTREHRSQHKTAHLAWFTRKSGPAASALRSNQATVTLATRPAAAAPARPDGEAAAAGDTSSMHRASSWASASPRSPRSRGASPRNTTGTLLAAAPSAAVASAGRRLSARKRGDVMKFPRAMPRKAPGPRAVPLPRAWLRRGVLDLLTPPSTHGGQPRSAGGPDTRCQHDSCRPPPHNAWGKVAVPALAAGEAPPASSRVSRKACGGQAPASELAASHDEEGATTSAQSLGRRSWAASRRARASSPNDACADAESTEEGLPTPRLPPAEALWAAATAAAVNRGHVLSIGGS
mmetsp:Transcript_6479/g.26693  ORF Transcript_6479/g.26693 Transcript_6479/m.26693 type:complete len:298 (-) Transcript_6479:157-1050(-)